MTMSESQSAYDDISLYPEADPVTVHSFEAVNIEIRPSISSASSTISSSSESEPAEPNNRYIRPASYRRSRIDRPKMADRQISSSIIVPKGQETYQREKPEYPPNDARAMSPRRSSVDLERLEQSARKSLKDHARTLQSSLAALAERIDEVRSDHDKLESENKFLQDYIGGLTRTMSGSGLGRSGSSAKKSKK